MLGLIPMGMLGAGGYVGYTQWRAIRARPEVSVGLVQAMTAGEAEKLLSAKGYLKSRNQAAIGAKVPGRVEKILIEEGTKVVKGDLLAILEHNDVDAQLASGKAQVARALADVVEAEADLEEKERRAKRLTNLALRSSTSREDVEQAEFARRRAEAKLLSLRALVDLQRQTVRQTEVVLENMSIRAPFDGTIVKKDAELGEMITGGGMGSGLSIGRSTVATIANLGRMDVETDVTENLLARLAVGQPAEISVAAAPSKRYRGRLRQIIPMSDRGRGTVKVMVEFLEPDESLFPELVATVHFLPVKAGGAEAARPTGPELFAPRSAVVAEGSSNYVFVVRSGKTVRRTKVEVLPMDDALVKVGRGVASGDALVLDPPKSLQDGDEVKVRE